MAEFRDLFPEKDEPLGFTSMVEHVIELEPDTKPIKQQPYRTSAQQKLAIEKHTEDLLKADYIEESHSPGHH